MLHHHPFFPWQFYHHYEIRRQDGSNSITVLPNNRCQRSNSPSTHHVHHPINPHQTSQNHSWHFQDVVLGWSLMETLKQRINLDNKTFHERMDSKRLLKIIANYGFDPLSYRFQLGHQILNHIFPLLHRQCFAHWVLGLRNYLIRNEKWIKRVKNINST